MNHRTRYDNMIRKRHELLDGVVTHTLSKLVELGVNPEAADLCANSVADMLGDLWGGQTLCIPMDFERKLSQKELQVWIYYHDENHSISQTAQHFGMGERGINKLLSRMRDRIKKQAKGEPALF